MAAYTTSQAGDWSDTATWGGSGPPGSGDTATIDHAVTVDQNTTVGDAPASGGVVLTVNAILTIASGVNFDVRGSINYNNASIQYPSGGAGGRLRLADCPDGGTYSHNISTTHNQTNAFLYIVGNATTPFTLDFTPAGTTGVGYIEDGGFIGGGQLRAQYIAMTLGGASRDNDFWARNTTAWNYYVKNSTLTSCGRFNNIVGLGADSKFNWLDNVHIGTLGANPLRLLGPGAAKSASGERNIHRTDFDKAPEFISPRELSFRYCIFRDAASWLGSFNAQWNEFYRCVYVKDDQTVDNFYGPMTEVYCVGTYTGANQHGFAPVGGLTTVTFDGLIFDWDCGDSAGDLIFTDSTGTLIRDRTIKNCLVLPRRTAGTAPGIFVSGSAPTSGASYYVNHNTVMSSGAGDNGAVLRLGETQVAYAGMVPEARSNLVWGASTGGHVVKQHTAGNITDAAITASDHNCGWGGSGAFSDNYEPADAKFGSTPGTGDVNEDPSFVDSSRNIEAWDTAQGSGTGTVSAALDHIRASIEARFDDLWSWVRAGFAPTNANFDGAAHDSGTIGAVPYAAAGNTPPPAPVLTAPADPTTVNNSVQLTWTQAPDADGDPITHYREYRVQSPPGSWVRSGPVMSGHIWDTSGLAEDDYDWRIIADDGTDETASTTTRTITVDHTNTPPGAPSWVTPSSDGQSFDTSVPLAWGSVTDPDGDPVLYRGEYKASASSTWLPLFSLQSPLSFSWNTGALADGDYNLRLYANDGTDDSVASTVRTVTIAHAATGATSGMTINGVDPIAYGVALESLEGVAGPPPHELEEQQVSGIPGTTVIERRVLSRQLALNYAIVGTDEADVRAKNDLFVALITEEQPFDLVLLRRSDRKLVCEYIDDPMNAIGPYLGTGRPAGSWRGRLSLTAPQPFWEDTDESSSTGITTTPVALPQGNGPTWLRFKIQGPAIDPRVDLYAWDDTLVASMQFSGTLASSSDWYTVDCELKTAYRNTTGLFTSGTDVLGTELPTPSFFQILRRYSRTRSSDYVQIACSAGTLQVYWNNRWGSG